MYYVLIPTTEQDTFQTTYKYCKGEEKEDPTRYNWTRCGSKLAPPTVLLCIYHYLCVDNSYLYMHCINYLKHEYTKWT